MIAKPFCPSCHRRHWELVGTEMAAAHCHMSADRFRRAVAAGKGPRQWTADVYVYPRYHVGELDRWLSNVAVAA